MPSVSKKQQKFMGIVRAIQKGEADPSDFNKDAQDAAKKMKKSSVKKYAKTKHKGLPIKKVNENKLEIKKIYQLLVKYGNTAKDAAEMLKKNYKYVAKTYRNSSPRGKAMALVGLSALGEGVQRDRNNMALYIIDLNKELSNAKVLAKKHPKYKKYIKFIQQDIKDAEKKLSKLKEERDYKAEYKKFQSSTKAKKYRAELNKYNRQKGTYGNGDGKDASHKGGKIVGFEKESKNRGRAEKSRLKKEITDYVGSIVDEVVINELSSNGEYVEDNARMMAKDHKRSDRKLSKAYDHIANRINQSFPGTTKITKRDVEDLVFQEPQNRRVVAPIKRYMIDDLFEDVITFSKKEMDQLHKGKLKKGDDEYVYNEDNLNENPAAIAAAQRMVVQNKMGKKVSVMTAKNKSYKEKDPSAHNKAKSIFQRIKDRFKKKNESQMLLQIAKQLKEADESVNEIKVWDVNEACWKGYEKKGMKTMFGKRYPNCVKKTKKKESVDEGSCGYGIDGKLGEEPAGPHLLKKKKKKNMKEASSNDVKRAIQIAKSMGGNMTGAVKKIEKMKRGLTKHKDVRNALKKANEGLADKFMKNIDKYNKKAKKSKDYLKKLKKKKR